MFHISNEFPCNCFPHQLTPTNVWCLAMNFTTRHVIPLNCFWPNSNEKIHLTICLLSDLAFDRYQPHQYNSLLEDAFLVYDTPASNFN